MMNTVMKYISSCLLLTALVGCVEEENGILESDSSRTLQVQVSEIVADSTDLNNSLTARTALGDDWMLATQTVDCRDETSGVSSRGVPITKATDLPNMGMAVYREATPAGGSAADFTITTPLWKRVQAVNQNKSGNWSIPGDVVIWPKGTDKLSFLAVSPYPTSAAGLAWANDGRTLEYTVPVVVTNQPDLCLAISVLNRQNEDGSGNHIVSFAFKHALTAITIKASAHKVKITSAIIKNIKTKGTLALSLKDDKANIEWSNVGTVGNRALSVKESVESSSMVDITKADGHLMMIPQALDNSAVLELVFDDLSKNPVVTGITKTVRLAGITSNSKWGAGQQIFYNLQLKNQYALTLTPTEINLEGNAGSYNNPGISYTTDNPKSPTATANQTWIKNLKVTNGKITFDYTENAGKERNAVITVTSGLTTKTVVVKQSEKRVVEEESNCYLLAPSGAMVKIPVKRANAGGVTRIGASDIITAEMLWQDTPGAIGSAQSCIASIRTVGVGANGSIEVKSGTAMGNAVIAVKVNNVVRWSWHIWVTAMDPNKTYKSFNGKQWLDRNLGATSNAIGSIDAVGLFYQWGRKDPFTSSASFSNRVAKTLYNAAGARVDYSYQYPGGQNFENAIKYPMTYYRVQSGVTEDWCGTETSAVNNSLWSNTKTPYDPCPKGWKIPKMTDFSGLQVGKNFIYKSNGLVHETLGYFPLAGNRSFGEGTIDNYGRMGFCWTTDIAETYRIHYFLYYSNTINWNFIHNKASAVSVRCIRE